MQGRLLLIIFGVTMFLLAILPGRFSAWLERPLVALVEMGTAPVAAPVNWAVRLVRRSPSPGFGGTGPVAEEVERLRQDAATFKVLYARALDEKERLERQIDQLNRGLALNPALPVRQFPAAVIGFHADLSSSLMKVRAGSVQGVLLINARATRVPDQARTLNMNQAIIEGPTGDIVCAMVSGEIASSVLERLLAGGASTHAPGVTHAIVSSPGFSPLVIDDTLLLSRPWHVRTGRDACLDQDLAMLVAQSAGQPAFSPHPSIITLGQHPVIVPRTATIMPGCILDVTAGSVERSSRDTRTKPTMGTWATPSSVSGRTSAQEQPTATC